GGITCADAVLFYAPMALGAGNPNPLYFGTDRLYRSPNGSTNMSVVSQAPIVSTVPISAIGVSRQNDNVRILGLQNGKVYATTTGSSTLTDVTSVSMPAKYVARAVIDPNNSNTAYVTFDGFGVPSGQHVWKTTNLAGGAANWLAAGSGIPDVPVNAFVIDPNDSTHLFAGTDIGVYYSSNAGVSWTPLGAGLPRVAVFDIAFVNNATPANRVLRIATHGRGMWELSAPLPLAVTTPTGGGTFCPGAAVMLSVTASGGAPGYTYQWRKGMTNVVDGGSIGGSHTAMLSINPSTVGDTGSYDCVVTDADSKMVTSGAAIVTISDASAPAVTPPTDATVTQTLCQ
ncbi:MAG TPA: immunoglobulin domain-containing protein, partial [Thermoanaerobaculia bacterium]|nr:immunoglobulin domain-containing protein [Thermoanaerobaculia bacterium]